MTTIYQDKRVADALERLTKIWKAQRDEAAANREELARFEVRVRESMDGKKPTFERDVDAKERIADALEKIAEHLGKGE